MNRIKSNFETEFYIPLEERRDTKNENDKYVHKRGIYKDTCGASQPWSDYRLRPNFLVAMVVVSKTFCSLVLTVSSTKREMKVLIALPLYLYKISQKLKVAEKLKFIFRSCSLIELYNFLYSLQKFYLSVLRKVRLVLLMSRSFCVCVCASLSFSLSLLFSSLLFKVNLLVSQSSSQLFTSK